MIRYVLSMGLNDKDTKSQKINTLEAYKMVENVIKSLQFEGATIYERNYETCFDIFHSECRKS